MLTKLRTILLFSLSISMISCKTMYMPSMQNVPMFEKKGELQATVAVHNIQAAYAISNRLGVIANSFFRNGNVFHMDDGNTSDYTADSFNYEIGIGTMFKSDSGSKLEVFAGYGHGSASLTYYYDAPPPYRGWGGSSSFNKYFIQPGIISQTENLQLCFSMRLSLLDFYDFKDLQNNELNYATPIFIEPAITLNKQVGFISFRGQIQFSIAGGSPGKNFGEYLPYKSMLLCNVGVTANLTRLIRGDY